MRRHTTPVCAYHFGPSTSYIGGMASVIATLITHHLGVERAVAVPTWVPGSHVRSGLLTVRAMALALSRGRDAAIHVHMSEGGSFVRETAIVAAARSRRLPCVITIHGPYFAEFAHRQPRLVKIVLGMASAITVLSEEDLAVVRRLVPHVPSEILPNPTPLDAVAGPVSETRELVLFAGEVGLRKGVDVLQRAWETVASRRPLATCVLVGPATDLCLPSTPRLEVRGPVELQEVRRLIRQARVIVLPSRREALPMILTEAMAAGRPFVSTPTGGVESLCAGGLIVPVEDEDALSRALIDLLASPTRAQSLGSAGRRLCQDSMSLQTIDARLRHLYALPRTHRSPATQAAVVPLEPPPTRTG